MKKLVKESILNEGFQDDFEKWMKQNDLLYFLDEDHFNPKEFIYALCKKVYDLEKELYFRTPEKGAFKIE